MNISDLIFVGIKGTVIALHRNTGEKVWATHLKGSYFVNVMLEDGAVVAACAGEIFCLDPLTGEGRWHNPLRGFGMGLVTMATERNPGSRNAPVQAQKHQQEEAAAASAAAC